jgi:hypothetical protein
MAAIYINIDKLEADKFFVRITKFRNNVYPGLDAITMQLKCSCLSFKTFRITEYVLVQYQ